MELRPQLPFARHDPITQLPNRQQFMSDYAQPRAAGASIVMITLADPRSFNELLRALGHDYADDFVRAGAAKVRACIPPDIKLYHVSILSIAFICPAGAERLAAELVRSFAQPLVCDGIPIVTRLGIGITDCLAMSATDPLRNALAAAQDSRRNSAGWAHYDRKVDNAHRRSFLLLSDLAAALESTDQLTLQFQPKYSLATGRPTSAEALLRWQHPALGQISPAEFIPLAETTAMIEDLTRWVLNRAVAQAARWEGAGLPLTMAVNVSPHNLSTGGFADRMAEILHRNKVMPPRIELEFTEGALASNDKMVQTELRGLRDAGVHIALDDFGTGFSSLSYVAHLPADIIKIDKSFIQRIGRDERSGVLVRSIIQLAHQLTYRVVAEGIETAEAYRLLTAWGCDEGQGFFMSRPLTADSFSGLMQKAFSRAEAAAG